MERGASTILAAALVIMLVTIAASSVALAEHLTTDVLIIGAGMCGISAGKTLSDNGLTDLLILEATDRIGGRMRIKEFAGINIELGANWVEGVNGSATNPLWALAEEVHLRTFYSDYSNMSSNVYDTSGLLPSQAQTQDLTNDANAYAMALSTSLHKNAEGDISILVSQRLFHSVPTTIVEMAMDYFLYDGEFAEPPRVTSLKDTEPLPTFTNFGPSLYFVADQRGFVEVLQPLATFLKKENGEFSDPRLKFHKVVNRIQYSKEGVNVSTEDGSTYSAKAAIFTPSIGVLQSELISFEPKLPFWKMEALFEYDMAIYTKIFLKFPYSFWPNGPATEYFLYADERRGYYPIWQVHNAAADVHNVLWWQWGPDSMDWVYPDRDHLDNEYPNEHIVFVTVTDDESRRVEQLQDSQIQAEMMAVLRDMFGPGIPDPQAFLIPRWWKNRFFRGTFTNWPIGVSQQEFQKIRAPIDRLYFAGEGTSDLYNGYVHGAYYEGIDAGKKVTECLQKNYCPSGPSGTQ